MKTFLPFLSVLLSAIAFAQTPIERAVADLKSAQTDLQAVRNESAALRGALYREINQLSDQTNSLATELRKLDRAWDTRQASERFLRSKVSGREAELKFVSGVLSTHITTMMGRLSVAERQLFQEPIDAQMRTATNAGDDKSAKLIAEIEVLNMGIDRLSQVAGGHTFAGNGLNDGESLPGNFALIGPAAYFVADSGDFAGISDFVADAQVTQPRIITIGDDNTTGIKNLVAQGSADLPYDGSLGKALVVQASNETLGEIAAKGGPVGYAILALGLVAVCLGAFKLYEIQTFRVPHHRKVNAILDDLISRDQEAARAKAANLPGESGALVVAGVDNFYNKRRVLEESLFEKLLGIRPKLDRFLPFLSLVAAAAPLMGLLGTVLGIIKTFKQMAIYGTGDAKSFSAGISEALITTAEGLVVAIPVLIIHGILRSLSKGKFSQIEAIAVSIMNGTSELEDSNPPLPGKEAEEPEDESLAA